MSTPYCPHCDSPVTAADPTCGVCRDERPVEGWPTDALLGRLFLEQYTVIRRLGSGGFGVVYLAENKEFGARRAIKLLDERHVHNDSILRRFKREAKALYRLQSPYTVRVERWGRTSDGHYYLVMELAEGETLRQILERRGRLDERRALSITRQTAVALSDAHALGILHRDLKPENLVIRKHPHEGERVAVLDFGISKILADETHNRRSGLVGTPSYMAPETFRPALGPHDIRADLWSLGVILYEMLTGRLPHEEDNVVAADPMATAYTVANLEPAEVLAALDALSVHTKTRAVLERLLQTRPAERYPTPTELLADLDLHPLWATASRRQSHPDTPVPGDDGDAPPSATPATRLDTTVEAGPEPTVDSDAYTFGGAGGYDSDDTFAFEDEAPDYLRLGRSGDERGDDRRRGPALGPIIIAVVVLGLIALASQFADELLGGGGPQAARLDAGAETDVAVTRPSTTRASLEGVTLHLVEGGEYVMGLDEPATLTPAHEVVLDPFYVDEREVSVGMWLACAAQGRCRPEHVLTARDQRGCRALDGRAEEAPLPMNCVSWEGARTYCQLYSRRLPTEAEWERAARGAAGRVVAQPTDAELGGPAGFGDGLLEWVSDWYASDWYDVSPTFDPRGSLFGTTKVVRDAAEDGADVRLVDRASRPPETQSPEIGFRCAQGTDG